MTGDASLSRRRSLALIVKLMLLIAVLAFVRVIFSSLTFNEHTTNEIPGYFINIDVSNLEAGKLRKVTAFEKEIWIYRRSEDDIWQLKKVNNSLRSVSDEYFVFFPYEPLRNCLIQWDEHDRTFYDPCFANQYDLAGRIVKGKHKDQVLLLNILKYRFSLPGQLIIDARLAAIR